MDLGKIVEDAVMYPLSDWKKILVLGILMVMISISVTLLSIGTLLGIKNLLFKILIFIVGYIILGFFVDGYKLRIIKTSINGASNPPKFNRWIEMFVDGIKVSIVVIIYSIPAILIVVYAALSLYPIVVSLITNPSSMNIHLISSILSAFILVLLAGLYMLIILPVNYIAIAHMANNNSKIGFAFRFHEIIDKMGSIGWGNILIWYLVTGTIYILISIVGSVITGIFSLIIPFLGVVLTSLTISPYLQMYLNRSIALVYMSE